MIIQEQAGYFQLEGGFDLAGLFQLSVEVSTQGFSGGTVAMFTRGEIASFLTQLKTLESERQGSAVLQNGHTPEYRSIYVECFSLDKLGHMGLRVEVAQGVDVGTHLSPLRAAVTFEIDPSKLQYFISETQALLATVDK